MSAPQAPAVKPLSLNTLRHGSISKHHGPARGAASAYVPSKASTTVGLSEAYVGARLAAFAASAQKHRQAQSPSPARQRNGSVDGSPNRGRQLHSNVNVISSAARSAASPASSNSSPKPVARSRPSPTAAAKYASYHHPTPRSPTLSPQRKGKSVSPVTRDGKTISDINALSGAVVSMSSSPTRSVQEPMQPVKSRVLDLEKIPVLLASEKPQTTRDTAKRQVTSPREERGKSSFFGYSISVQSSPTISRRGSAQSTSRMHALPPELSRHSSQDSSFSLDTVMGRGDLRSAVARSPGPRRRQTASSTHSTLRPLRDDYRSGMTVNALADAMVASSLASSRTVSPAKKKKAPPPPPPVPRRSRSVTTISEIKSAAEKESARKHVRHHRPMKQTLRKHGASDDEGAELVKRGRRHWMRKHPNMHSEGDRKRWRDRMTETERKRYEGVFAANRGLLIGSGRFVATPSTILDNAEGNQVVNVIVRDIWERSRLPRDVLRDIYELVAPEEPLALNREQFVVGMWLIDQRLKGRKLPVKVTADVWSSVRHTQGIKIKSMHS